MSSLPTALDFPETEEEICKRWEEEDTFKQQNKLAKDRNDEVCCWLCYFISFIAARCIFHRIERTVHKTRTQVLVVYLPRSLC